MSDSVIAESLLSVGRCTKDDARSPAGATPGALQLHHQPLSDGIRLAVPQDLEAPCCLGQTGNLKLAAIGRRQQCRVHVEYLQRGRPDEIVAAIRREFQTLKRLIEA